jgi:polyferredoxin
LHRCVRPHSEYSIQTGNKLKFTPRIIAYTAVLLLLVATESFLLVTRTDLDVTVVRAKGTMFYTEKDGRISNLYNVKIINKTTNDLKLDFLIEKGGAEVRIVGDTALWVRGDSLIDTQFFILQPAQNIHEQKQKMEIEVWSHGEKITEEQTTFLGPAHKK